MFGLIALGASIIGGVTSHRSSKKAASAGKRADDLAAKRSAIANVQNRRAAAASIRRQQAIQRSASIFSGMGGGSADKATAGSIAAQGLSSISYQEQQVELGAEINSQISSQNSYANRASNQRAAGNLVAGVATMAGRASQPVPELPAGVGTNN